MTDNTAFNELMKVAGWLPEIGGSVSITGNDPILPTRFRVGEMAAGIHAACGFAVSKLWELSTGRKQTVAVDVRAAAASLRSYWYMRKPNPDGSVSTVQSERGQLSMMDFFQTQDNNWIFLHAGRDHFRDNALKFLQCDVSTESIAAAIAKWEAQPLEDAFEANGCMAVIARSIEQWHDHPQGKILCNLPAVEIIKIGDSPPEPLPKGPRPLSGIRVLDVTNVLSGPTCGRTLAEHGADVLRVDSPDDFRMKPLTFVIDTGHGKRSAFLNLKKETDYKKAVSLIEQGDIFSENYRLGKMEQIGLSPGDLARIRPGIICTSINCYGYEGPWRRRPGMEQIGQTAAGLSREEGGSGRPRTLPGAITDYSTGYLAAFGCLVALYRRATEGGSYHVRASLTQSAMMLTRIKRADFDVASIPVFDANASEINDLCETVVTPYGPMTRLAPVVRLSETPAHWDLPPVPLGTHPPVWSD